MSATPSAAPRAIGQAVGETATDPGKAWRRERGIPVVPAFDGYRALAIGAVVLFHVLQVCGVFNAAGRSALGVVLWGTLPRSLDALFIVSGFVLFLPTVARDGAFGSVQAFAVRRAARLVPAYWATLVVAIALLVAVDGSSAAPGPGEIATHVAVLQTPALLVDGDFRLGFGVIPPVWTLSVEVGFYVVLPLIAAWYFRRPFLGLAAAAVVLVVWRLFAEHSGAVAGWVGIDLSRAAHARLAANYGSQFPNWAVALAAGMTAAWLYVRIRDAWTPEVLARRAAWGTAIAGAALALFVYLAGHEAVTDASPFAGLFARQSVAVALGYPLVLAATLLAISLGPTWLALPVSNRPLRWLADISYGVYLIHFAVIFLGLRELDLPRSGTAGAALVWSAVVYPASIAYAYLSAKYLERPVRRRAHRFGRRARREASPHAVA